MGPSASSITNGSQSPGLTRPEASPKLALLDRQHLPRHHQQNYYHQRQQPYEHSAAPAQEHLYHQHQQFIPVQVQMLSGNPQQQAAYYAQPSQLGGYQQYSYTGSPHPDSHHIMQYSGLPDQGHANDNTYNYISTPMQGFFGHNGAPYSVHGGHAVMDQQAYYMPQQQGAAGHSQPICHPLQMQQQLYRHPGAVTAAEILANGEMLYSYDIPRPVPRSGATLFDPNAGSQGTGR